MTSYIDEHRENIWGKNCPALYSLLHRLTPKDQFFKVLMHLLNYAFQTHSWEMLSW